jgi:site-specific recombinase XerD
VVAGASLAAVCKPAVASAEISNRVGFQTFRHTHTTLLSQNSEDLKVVQELLRHANSHSRSLCIHYVGGLALCAFTCDGSSLADP